MSMALEKTGASEYISNSLVSGLGGEPEASGHGWFKVDNFTLFYNSEDIPTGIDNVKTNGAVTTIASRQFFTVGGAQVAAPQKGVNIVKNIMSDGTVKVSKVIVK